MSRNRARGVLAAVVLTMGLGFGLPAASEAAGSTAASRDGYAWSAVSAVSAVWHWIAELWAAKAPQTRMLKATGSTGQPPATTDTCKTDQGVCIDPNG